MLLAGPAPPCAHQLEQVIDAQNALTAGQFGDDLLAALLPLTKVFHPRDEPRRPGQPAARLAPFRRAPHLPRRLDEQRRLARARFADEQDVRLLLGEPPHQVRQFTVALPRPAILPPQLVHRFGHRVEIGQRLPHRLRRRRRSGTINSSSVTVSGGRCRAISCGVNRSRCWRM